MSEDSRSGRKPSRQLYIANPGSDDDDPKQHVANGRANVPINSRLPLNPSASSPYKLTTSQSNSLPAPDHPAPDSHHQHNLSQSSSSPDNSASPSSPPTTPGFPSFNGSSYDKSDTSSTISYAPTLTPSNDRAHYDSQASASYKSSRTPKQYIKPPSGGRPLPPRADPSRRPNAFTGHDYQSSPAVMSASPDRVIIATKDSELYVTVDLSGVKTAPQMRELILNKLKIYEDEGNPYLIYQTEIGAYAIGDPLSDARLLSLCREQGDSKGTLKFLVTHSFAPVHEPPPPSHPVDYCPMPPPAHATHVPIKPLRTKPRQSSRSRNGSISSSSEILTPEIANGYDADIDNPEASPPKPSSLPPSPPRRPSLGNQGRSGSPDQPTSPPPATDRRINGRKEDRLTHALPPIPLAPPPAPPLSPNRPSFPSHGDLSPSLSVPSDRRHARSGSDAGADRELSSRANDPYSENNYRLRNSQHSSLTHLKSPASRDNIRTQSRKPTYDDDDGQEITLPNGGRSVVDVERHSPTLQRRPLYGQSQRPNSPYTSRSHITQNPTRGLPTGLPSVAPSETRLLTKTRGQLPFGNAFVPYSFAESAHKKQPPASSSSWQNNRLAKNSTKSMDNLKFASQAGSSRRNPIPPTPQLPILSNTNNRDVAYSPSSTLSLSGMPKSYETSPRFIRPLPQKGLPPGNTFDILPSASSQYSSRGYPPTLTSPNYEPFPRPQSAASDAISPTRSIPHSQSPIIYGSSLDSGDHNRSPRTVSPNRSYHSPGLMGGGGPRPRPTNSDRSDGPDHSPPPLTPQDSQQEERGIVDPSPPLSPRGIVDKDSNSSSELTLKEDGKRYFAKLLGNATPTGTQVTSQTVEQPRSGKRLTPSPPPLERNDSSSSYAFEDDEYDSYIGGGTWIVRPEPGKNAARPPLKVQIETPTRSSTGEDARPDLPPKDAPPSRPPPVDPNLLRVQSRRPESTFIDPDSDNWAPRPPPENIYEELEKFFPKHDLDKPVIEASSGDTSPTNAEPVAALPPMPIPDDRGRIRAKKSIRIVAQEHKKRIDRTSKAADAIAQKDNMMRKRSTKLWGSKLEEVTTLRNNSTISLPESPSGGPTTFKWVRGELIGKGTYGRVYLALNATTGEMIAVKQVELPQTASDKNDTRQHTVVQALKMESETLRDLDHPHIVQYLGFEETPANLSIFLEYVPGGSVGSCLHKHGKFADNVTRSFTAQILSGLEYLHSKGILHRDMKADNILVEMSGTCKISDFGISKRTEDLQGGAFTAMQGTVFWMAPEVVNAQKKGYNFKVDIWSVGCVVLEMWAGKRPWTGEEMVAVMFKLYQSKQPPPVPDDVVLGEDADDFRQKCFAINPEERPSAAELRKHPYLILPPGWAFTGFT